jgi:diguanylate cyclase (GGDEF)-like protein
VQQTLALLWKRSPLQDAALVACVVTCAALFGILTRPIGFLSLFWPANAILMGLVIRQPRLAAPACWVAAFAGYMFADLITGDDFWTTLWLTAANVVGVFSGWMAFRAMGEQNLRLTHPLAFLYMLAAAAAAALAASLVGCWMSPSLLQRDPLWGAGFWFASELVNYVVILPVALTAPGLPQITKWLHTHDLRRLPPVADLAPVVALVSSVVLAHFVGGPGAIAIPAPAMLWCALRYPIFPTALLTLLLCAWQMVTSVDVLAYRSEGVDPVYMSTSIRLGLALFALAPLTVGTVNQARNELMKRLSRAISHDHLTGTLARGSFVERAEALLSRRSDTAVMMIDLDLFKQVNDTHGHAIGDRALVAFAEAARAQLGPQDLLGRIGGEEFGAILVGVDETTAKQAGERVRAATEALVIATDSGNSLRLTVSVGIAMGEAGLSFDELMLVADSALYHAKQSGRNQVHLATSGTPTGTRPSSSVRRAA